MHNSCPPQSGSQPQDEHTFIGFDCAYRTLGWCVLGYNPRVLTRELRATGANALAQCLRDLFHLRAGGVEDVLGDKIDEFDQATRARQLAAGVRRILTAAAIDPATLAQATVIIERQPRKRKFGFTGSSVHDTNQTIEAQLVFYFSVMCPARCVYLISAGKKNRLACALLSEPRVKTYPARKKQSRRAYVHLASMFNFDAHPQAREFRHVKADRADACVQIIAAIFLCADNI